MNLCSKCGSEGPFYKRVNGDDCSLCKLCQNECSRNHYKANKKQYLDRNKKYQQRIQDCLIEYLRKHPCVDCSETALFALDFDHVRGKKKFNVSTAVARGYSWFVILREIEKCEVRCSNCHRKRTFGHSKKYQRTCRLTDKALVYETSNDGSSPSESSTGLSFSAQDSPLLTEQPRLESV